MKMKEIREKNEKDLQKMEKDLQEGIVEAYLGVRTGKVKDVRKPRRMRKELAVIRTILSERNRANLKEK